MKDIYMGKCEDTGEIVYGFYVNQEGEEFIYVPMYPVHDSYACNVYKVEKGSVMRCDLVPAKVDN